MWKQIGDYQLIARIGEGNMGVVYRARKGDLDVALKVISPRHEKDEIFLHRFQREIETVTTLDHPNIVRAFDHGRDKEAGMYIAFEYIEGKSLQKVLNQQVRLPLQRALEICQQVAQALVHAHDHDIIHRDIKPENILLGKDDKVKIVDFGLAKSERFTNLTGSGVVLGTAYYLSPEQALGTSEIDARTDIYALAMTMYHILVGRPPFVHRKPMLVIRDHCHTPLPPMGEFLPELPATVDDLVLQMAAKDQNDRMESAFDVVRRIDRLLQDIDFASIPHGDVANWQPFDSSQSITLTGTISDVKGQIEILGLPELIQSIVLNARTGVLSLQWGKSDEGNIYFDQGQIIHAESSDKRGEEGFFDVVRQAGVDGRFAFRKVKKLDVEKTIFQDTMSLLMEALRILDETLRSRRESDPQVKALTGTLTGMIGRLEVIHVLDVINTLVTNQKTGVLIITEDDDTRGEIYFVDGQIIHATAGERPPKAAIFYLLSREKGTFRFREEKIFTDPTIEDDTLALLMEGQNRLDKADLEQLGLD